MRLGSFDKKNIVYKMYLKYFFVQKNCILGTGKKNNYFLGYLQDFGQKLLLSLQFKFNSLKSWLFWFLSKENMKKALLSAWNENAILLLFVISKYKNQIPTSGNFSEKMLQCKFLFQNYLKSSWKYKFIYSSQRL